MDNILTVVIPTFERQNYLIYAIKSCLKYPEITIIINDNSLRPLILEEIFDLLELDRIKYFWTPNKMSVVENFARNLDNINSKYITFIGDDDALGVGIDEALLFMDQNNVEALTMLPDKALHYFWEDSFHPIWKDISNTLFYDLYTWKYKRIDLSKVINKCNSKLGSGPMGLPRLYLGIVKTEIIKNLVVKYGNVFGGYSPDIFSSILLSYNINKAFYIDAPIIIPGACKKSTSGLRSERKDVGAINGENHLSRFEKILWHESIPKIYSPYTVWGYTHIIALNKILGRNIESSYTNYLIAKLIVDVPFSRSTSIKFFLNKDLIDKALVFWSVIQIFFEKIIRFIKILKNLNPGAAKFKKKQINTILQAHQFLEK